MMGDASIAIESELIKEYPELKCDVLKVSHHGSNTGSSADFLAQIQPQIGLVSVARHNLYGHPHEEVMSRLNAYGIRTYLTSENGMVHLYFKMIRPG